MGDIARANLLAAESDHTDDVYNVACGTETSLLELAADAAAGDGRRPRRRARPGPRGQRRHAPAGEHRPRAPTSSASRPQVDLEEGLTRLVEWWRAERAGAPAEPISRLAKVRGGVMEVPFAKPYLRGDEGAAVAEVIASGWVSQGPRVREFEAAFAERVGAAEAVAVSNCTTALHLALHVAGRRPRRRGDRPVDVVHRHRQRGLAVRCDAGVRRRRPAHVQPRRRRRRARDHRAHQGDHARPPARPAGGHGRVLRARRRPRAAASSRTPRARSAPPTRAARSARWDR